MCPLFTALLQIIWNTVGLRYESITAAQRKRHHDSGVPVKRGLFISVLIPFSLWSLHISFLMIVSFLTRRIRYENEKESLDIPTKILPKNDRLKWTLKICALSDLPSPKYELLKFTTFRKTQINAISANSNAIKIQSKAKWTTAEITIESIYVTQLLIHHDHNVDCMSLWSLRWKFWILI